MNKKMSIEDMNFEYLCTVGCIDCAKEYKEKGLRSPVFSDWIILDLQEDIFEGKCLRCFHNWITEMENGEHGLFQRYQTVMINRIFGKLFDLNPHNDHRKKNLESFK